MKVNVKGLVFVGFAAAILSGAAKADDKQIVTSKAFTEATYQKKIGGTAGQLPVTTAAAGTVEYKTIETNKTGITTNADTIPTSAAVAGAIADANSNANGRQTASTANFQVGAEGGAWKQIVTDSYTALAVDNTDTSKVNLTVAVTDDGTLANAVNSTGDNSADYNKLTTGHAVKAYADSKVASAVTDNDTTHAPSGEAVYEQLALKQNASTAVTYDGTNATGSATQPVYIAADGTATPTTHSLGMTVPAAATGADAATKVLNAAGNWVTPDWNAAANAAGYIANKPSVEVTGNKASTIVADGTENDTTSSTTLYTTNAAVTGYAQKKLAGTQGQVVTFGAEPGSVTGTALATVATTGSYSNLSDKPAYDLPAIPSGTTCNASTPCALVLAGEAPTWVNMAQ